MSSTAANSSLTLTPCWGFCHGVNTVPCNVIQVRSLVLAASSDAVFLSYGNICFHLASWVCLRLCPVFPARLLVDAIQINEIFLRTLLNYSSLTKKLQCTNKSGSAPHHALMVTRRCGWATQLKCVEYYSDVFFSDMIDM